MFYNVKTRNRPRAPLPLRVRSFRGKFMNKQSRAPIFETLLAHAKRKVVSFHTPGHKNGKGIDPKLKQFTGKAAYFLDVTVFPEVDSLHDPVGPIKKAQTLIAEAYGVEHSFLLINGSTIGNQAMLMSACSPGDSIIVSRNAHKSILAGIILRALAHLDPAQGG